MAVSSYYMAIVLGLCLSLLVEIKFGVTPGGFIVPCYMALVIDNPAVVLNIFLVAIITYLIIKYGISKIMLIYGKRRFIACVLIAIIVKALLNLLYPAVPFSVFAFNGIGVVTSGIIANTYFRQGVILTSIVTVLTSVVVFLAISLVYLF